MEKGTCFMKTFLHVINYPEYGEVDGDNSESVPLDEVQTVSRLSPSLFSQPCRFRRAVKSASFPPGEAKGGLYEFDLVHSKWYSAYRRKPLRRDAPSSALH